MLLFNHTWAQNIAPPLLVTKITYANMVVEPPTRLYQLGRESDERYYPQGSEIHEGIDNRQHIHLPISEKYFSQVGEEGNDQLKYMKELW